MQTKSNWSRNSIVTLEGKWVCGYEMSIWGILWGWKCFVSWMFQSLYPSCGFCYTSARYCFGRISIKCMGISPHYFLTLQVNHKIFKSFQKLKMKKVCYNTMILQHSSPQKIIGLHHSLTESSSPYHVKAKYIQAYTHAFISGFSNWPYKSAFLSCYWYHI